MIQVTSEIGRLRRALVHEPGVEVDRMVPAMMEQLLFDDILYGDRARDEHARFRRVLQLFGVEVLDSSKLLEEALSVPEARRWLLQSIADDMPRTYLRRLQDLPPDEMATALVAGMRRDVDQPGVEAEDLYGIPPLPNWCFQRDTQVVFGNGVFFSSMAGDARYREALLTRTVFRFHPQLRETPVRFDPLAASGKGPHALGQHRPQIEGGDVIVISSDLLVVGQSERTNRAAIRALARTLAADPQGPRWLIVVRIPKRRAYMHLDTLITQVDRNACLVYPPVILPGGSERATVQELDLRSDDLDARPVDDLLTCLASHDVELEPIPCGGDDHVTQQREQWTDGANALALAPGVITLYSRNVATAEVLARHGFEIVEAEDLLLGRIELDPENSGRVCIRIQSHEISRARGGPHCLVHPLLRDEVLDAGS